MPNSRQAYARLPQQDDSELDAAFQSDDEHETRALIPAAPAVAAPSPATNDGTYDFEPRFEDYASMPPPGSPPDTPWRPADIGNSNGLLPGPPALPQRPSWLSRTLSRLRGAREQPRAVGRGNDGVWGNVVAKPTLPTSAADDDVRVQSEDARTDAPPSYVAASADPAPTYWAEVHAPDAPSINMPGELIVEDLPTGSVLMFIWAAFITTSFAWVGVLLAYLLSGTSHAGRHGSRAGLGFWFVRLGFDLMTTQTRIDLDNLGEDWHVEVINGTERFVYNNDTSLAVAMDDMQTIASYRNTVNGWMSILLLFTGFMVLVLSLGQFYKIKKYESAVLGSTLPEQSTLRNLRDRSAAVRRFLFAPTGRDAARDEERGLSPNAQGTQSDQSQH